MEINLIEKIYVVNKFIRLFKLIKLIRLMKSRFLCREGPTYGPKLGYMN